MFKIVLDAGHGRNTPGKRCLKSLDPAETREWVLNARICDKVERLLANYSGYELLRADDRTGAADVSLKARTDAANRWGADLYLSVHHNAGLGGRNGGGPEVYVYTSPSAKTVEYQKIIHDCFVARAGKFGNRANEMPRKNLHVCRETHMPSVLIECGFMDSPGDVPLILSESFADKAAQGLTEALVQIGGLKKVKEETSMAECKFTDISGHYGEKQIREVFEMGIMNGVDETHFEPDKPVTRAQAAIIARNVVRYITGK